MTYFPLLYRLRAQDRYLIWAENGPDSVITNSTLQIPTFTDISELQIYAQSNGYTLQLGQPGLHDLDWVATWCANSNAEINCDQALAAWNLFADVASSVGDAGRKFNVADASAKTVYQKVFWGNNLPSVTPKGRRYIPEWSDNERLKLKAVLSQGLKLFECSIFAWDMRLIS